MKKAQPLPLIEQTELSPIQQKGLILDDDKAYNDLAIRHNNLISHVEKFCRSRQ